MTYPLVGSFGIFPLTGLEEVRAVGVESMFDHANPASGGIGTNETVTVEKTNQGSAARDVDRALVWGVPILPAGRRRRAH